MGFEFLAASPVLVMAICSIIAIMLDAMNEDNKKLGYMFSLFSIILSGCLAFYNLSLPGNHFASLTVENTLSRGMLNFGGFAYYLDILFCLSAVFTIVAGRNYIRAENKEKNEFYNLLLYALSGMMLIAHSNHMLVLFIGIELMSITFYILAGYFRDSVKSVESALKYFLLGSFATGFLLYGMAMIFGATSTMYFHEITKAVETSTAITSYLTIGFGLLIIGLSFKIAAFPFHQWAPDVYSGSPTVVTAFMSTAGKAAGLIAMIVVAKALMPLTGGKIALNISKFQTGIAVISAVTMLVGNITAVVQKNIKRMLAYSSVAHAGYLLMGIVANSADGRTGILFYATAYTFMQIGAFIVVSMLEKNTDKNLDLDDYTGLSKTNPVLASIMAVFMFSLAGIPPMAGFYGKYFLFSATIDAGFTWLTIVAVISSIISMYFYIGLIVYMFFKDPVENTAPLQSNNKPAYFTLVVSVIAIFLFGIMPSLLENYVKNLF